MRAHTEQEIPNVAVTIDRFGKVNNNNGTSPQHQEGYKMPLLALRAGEFIRMQLH
jgi:hypothetical protein